MTYCDFSQGSTCPRCGYTARRIPLMRHCIARPPGAQRAVVLWPAPSVASTQGLYSRGLGDMVAAGLSSVGITKERAQAVANAIGIEDCGCSKRQQLLNEWGRAIGIGGPPPAAPSGPVVD